VGWRVAAIEKWLADRPTAGLITAEQAGRVVRAVSRAFDALDDPTASRPTAGTDTSQEAQAQSAPKA
jgi:hypothetical protein